jgi:molybdate transport system regulatory protein
VKTLVIRFRIDFDDDSNVGPGKIGLLEAIKISGSISQAARDLGMSYRRGWLLINSLNRSFEDPVVISATGGAGGGGARLTEFGERLLDVYRDLERDITELGQQRLKEISKLVTKQKHPAAVARKALQRKLDPTSTTF